jgi:hypothetical protein
LNQTFSPLEDAVLVENESSAPMAQSGRAVRRGDFKLIAPDGGSEEFYDLRADPLESTNLLSGNLTATQSAALDIMRAKLAAWRNVPNLENPQRNAQFSAETPWFANANLSLWRAADLSISNWVQVGNPVVQDLGFTIRLTDPQPPAGKAFYRARSD